MPHHHRGAHAAPSYDGPTAAMESVAPRPSRGAHAAPDADFLTDRASSFVPQSTAQERRGLKPAVVAAIVAFAIILIAYVIGAFYFSTHFFPRTTMGSLDVSGMSQIEAQQVVEDAEKTYTLSVSGMGLSFSMTPSDGGMGVDPADVVSNALAQERALLWPIAILRSHDVTDALVATVDGGKLGDFIESKVDAYNASQTPSADAYVAYDSSKKSFAVMPETYGTQMSSDAVIAKAASAIGSFEGEVKLDDGDLIKPEVRSDDKGLAASAKSANDLLGAEGDIVFGTTGVKVATIDADIVSQFVVFGNDGTASIDNDAVSAWVSDFASSLSTVGTTRTFTRGDGESVTASGGDYGWAVSSDAAAEAIEEFILDKSRGQLTLDATQSGNGYVSANQDWGAYVDVDLTEQHARYYDAKGDLQWESDFISGSPKHSTPTGIYYLKALQRHQTLIGKPDPETKKPEYETPVDYWMPFIGNAVGFHDAPWQSSAAFADPAGYTYTGSHGCINLPPDKAKDLFGILKVGDAVVVHS